GGGGKVPQTNPRTSGSIKGVGLAPVSPRPTRPTHTATPRNPRHAPRRAAWAPRPPTPPDNPLRARGRPHPHPGGNTPPEHERSSQPRRGAGQTHTRAGAPPPWDGQ